MSYRREIKKDFINEMFTRYRDFQLLSHHLLEAKNFEEFEIWFEKLELIDKRTLYLFICENQEKIDPEYLDIVSDRFIKFF